MTAADAREELEAAIWHAVTYAIRNADKQSDGRLEAHVKAALAKGDDYADQLATASVREALDEQRRHRDAVIGAEAERRAATARRAEATAERTGRAS